MRDYVNVKSEIFVEWKGEHQSYPFGGFRSSLSVDGYLGPFSYTIRMTDGGSPWTHPECVFIMNREIVSSREDL